MVWDFIPKARIFKQKSSNIKNIAFYHFNLITGRISGLRKSGIEPGRPLGRNEMISAKAASG
jgi:hypothetical protein